LSLREKYVQANYLARIEKELKKIRSEGIGKKEDVEAKSIEDEEKKEY